MRQALDSRGCMNQWLRLELIELELRSGQQRQA